MFGRSVGLLLLVGSFTASAAVAQLALGTRSDPALAGGEWLPVEGWHCGKDLTKEQLAKIKFECGEGGYAIDLAPVIPAGDWPTSYLCNVRPAAKQLSFTRNVGLKGIAYYGIYEVNEDTLRIGFALVPWERTSGDPSFAMNAPKAFPSDKNQPGGPSTVLTFKRIKK